MSAGVEAAIGAATFNKENQPVNHWPTATTTGQLQQLLVYCNNRWLTATTARHCNNR